MEYMCFLPQLKLSVWVISLIALICLCQRNGIVLPSHASFTLYGRPKPYCAGSNIFFSHCPFQDALPGQPSTAQLGTVV